MLRPRRDLRGGPPAQARVLIAGTRAPSRCRRRPHADSIPGSDLDDGAPLELTTNGDLILAGGYGNSYRLAQLGAANNPSGCAGVIRVKTPA